MTSMPSTLPRRPFGPTDLQVAPLCIGCAPLGNMPEAFAYSVAEEQALATLRAAFPLNPPITPAHTNNRRFALIVVVLAENHGAVDLTDNLASMR